MATISAAQAVGEYLQSPDDLMKTLSFRKKLEKEKASIDSKLRSGVREQLDATREGLRKLLGTRENVNALKEEIRGIEALFKDDKNEVKTFDQISRVSDSSMQNYAILSDAIRPFPDGLLCGVIYFMGAFGLLSGFFVCTSLLLAL